MLWAEGAQFITEAHQAHMPSTETKKVDFIQRGSIGKMAESKRATSPSFSISRAPRDEYLKSFMSKEAQVRLAPPARLEAWHVIGALHNAGQNAVVDDKEC